MDQFWPNFDPILTQFWPNFDPLLPRMDSCGHFTRYVLNLCHVTNCGLSKGGFYSESAMRFLDLQISKKNYSEKLSWAWNLNLLFTVIGGKFEFQAQDSFSEYFFLEIWKSKKCIAPKVGRKPTAKNFLNKFQIPLPLWAIALCVH